MVAVCGPPQVGKSTLIRSLIKHYTRQNLTEIKGPITVVTGKVSNHALELGRHRRSLESPTYR